MTDYYIGLMSGTSLDGIDAALVRFDEQQPEIIATLYLPYTTDTRQLIQALTQPGYDEIQRMTELDQLLANEYAAAVRNLLEKENIRAAKIRAIGSHGQTLRHYPNAKQPTTLQIGDPNLIAELTGITTVADFRRRDMAAGGQGAPLVPAFHENVFHDQQINRVVLNLGGIANITCLPSKRELPVLGFDTGPGNTLMNQWIHAHHNHGHDADGRWAASGSVHQELLTAMLADPYFALPPPKSTGTDYFSPAWITQQLADFTEIAATDVQATLCELTAVSITDAIKQHAPHTDEVLVCGGGVHNDYLMQRLYSNLAGSKIISTAAVGLDPDYIEAIAFAWLAKQTLHHQPGNLPAVTGARHPVVLGGIYYGTG